MYHVFLPDLALLPQLLDCADSFRFDELKETNAALRGSHLTTAIVLVFIMIAANIAGTIVGFVGLSPVASILSVVTWLAVLALLVWSYSRITGEFSGVRDVMDGTVDEVVPRLLAIAGPHGATVATVLNLPRPAAPAKDKTD